MPYFVLRKGPFVIMISTSENITLLWLSFWVIHKDFYIEKDVIILL